MIGKVLTASHMGINGIPVEVEAMKLRGLPSILMTGLPGEVVKEARERIRGALTYLGYFIPSSKLIVHLLPASLKKTGNHFDLPVALSLLCAEDAFIQKQLMGLAAIGEVGLDGRLLPAAGAISLLECLESLPTVSQILVPAANAFQVRLLGAKKCVLVGSLSEAIAYVTNERRHAPPLNPLPTPPPEQGDLLDKIWGQNLAKRALQISLAGRHHFLMIGQPGIGKSLIANAAADLLPALSRKESVEIFKNRGPGYFGDGKVPRRPFRSPHHSISSQALLGGGSGIISPGEVSLAHHGVLFMDELPEFRRDALEGLREPLESGIVDINRVGAGPGMRLPARFTLLAAMNPCPCGYSLQSSAKKCLCTIEKIRSYRRRVSGPLLDRFDLCLVLHRVKASDTANEVSAVFRQQIEKARHRQETRYGSSAFNGDVKTLQQGERLGISPSVMEHTRQLSSEVELSLRSVDKLLRVARTIADLEDRPEVENQDVTEAFTFLPSQALREQW